jgi:hypothetical protein
MTIIETDLKTIGFSATELKKAGYTLTEIKKFGYTLIELKKAGFTASELLVAGFTELELLVSGFAIVEIIPEVGIILNKLKADLSIEVTRAKIIENELTSNVNKLNLLNPIWVQKTDLSN